MIEIIQTETELRACFPILKQLHPTLNEDELIPLYQPMRRESYPLARLTQSNQTQAVMGLVSPPISHSKKASTSTTSSPTNTSAPQAMAKH